MLDSLPPALWLLLAAPLVGCLRGRACTALGILAPLLALGHAWLLMAGEAAAAGPVWQFLGHQVQLVSERSATAVFATIFCIMAMVGTLYGANRVRPVELAGAMVYAGGALGVTFAGDWLSLFMFWEVMTLGSTTIIFAERSKQSYGAGMRYFGVHAVGGVILFAGICWLLSLDGQGSLLGPLGQLTSLIGSGGEGSGAAWLILIGMLVNAGAPPLSAWIGDAYPAATETGTVWLSAYTTKTAVFTLLGSFAGTEVLIYVGMYMACYGIVYAILENDIRRILAYSIVNQVGFMVCGIGMAAVGTDAGRLAIDGVCAHAFAHIIYKALLLMSAGAVVQATGKKLCSEVGGLYRTMPVTMWCGIIGALAISSFPLTSGYTTKSMITAAAAQLSEHYHQLDVPHGHLITAWFVLEAASAGVFLHAGIKFPWFVFFQKDSGLRPPDAPRNMQAAMILFAALCLGLGLTPGAELLYGLLPYGPEATEFSKHNYDHSHIIQMLGLLLFSGLAFFLLLPMLKRTRSITLDTDWLYRSFAPRLWRRVLLPALGELDRLRLALIRDLPAFLARELGREGQGLAGLRIFRPWSIGAVVALITALLCIILALHYAAS